MLERPWKGCGRACGSVSRPTPSRSFDGRAELVSRLEDILEAIAVIGEYTAGKTFDDYAAERMLRDAVERNVERISEASRHIPEILKDRYPEIDWRKVAGAGNILRHAYPIVDDSVIWEVVIRDLPALQAATEGMLRRIEKDDPDPT